MGILKQPFLDENGNNGVRKPGPPRPILRLNPTPMEQYTMSPRLLWLTSAVSNLILLFNVYYAVDLLIRVYNNLIISEEEWNGIVEDGNQIIVMDGSKSRFFIDFSTFMDDPVLKGQLKRDVILLYLGVILLAMIAVANFIIVLIPLKIWKKHFRFALNGYYITLSFAGIISLMMISYGYCYTKGEGHAIILERLIQFSRSTNSLPVRESTSSLLEAVLNCPKPTIVEFFWTLPVSNQLCMNHFRITHFPALCTGVAYTSLVGMLLKKIVLKEEANVVGNPSSLEIMESGNLEASTTGNVSRVTYNLT